MPKGHSAAGRTKLEPRGAMRAAGMLWANLGPRGRCRKRCLTRYWRPKKRAVAGGENSTHGRLMVLPCPMGGTLRGAPRRLQSSISEKSLNVVERGEGGFKTGGGPREKDLRRRQGEGFSMSTRCARRQGLGGVRGLDVGR